MSLRLSTVRSSKKQIFSPLNFDSISPDNHQLTTTSKQHDRPRVTTTEFLLEPSVVNSIQEKHFQQPCHNTKHLITPQFKKSLRSQPILHSFNPPSTFRDPLAQIDAESNYRASSEESLGSFQNLGLDNFQVEEDNEVVESSVVNHQTSQPYQQSLQQSLDPNQIDICSSKGSIDFNVVPQSLEPSVHEVSGSQLNIEQSQESAMNNPSEMMMCIEQLIYGYVVQKYGRNDKFSPGKRIIQITPDLKLIVIRNRDHKITKVFALDKVQRIEKGQNTENFRRFKLKIEQQCTCFSIFLIERTIDLQTETVQQMNSLIDSINCLLH